MTGVNASPALPRQSGAATVTLKESPGSHLRQLVVTTCGASGSDQMQPHPPGARGPLRDGERAVPLLPGCCESRGLSHSALTC